MGDQKCIRASKCIIVESYWENVHPEGWTVFRRYATWIGLLYVCNIMGCMLPKAVVLLLGEMSWRLLEVLPIYMLYLLICFITLAGRK